MVPKCSVVNKSRVVVSSSLERPFSDRWILATHVAVLVGQRPWFGPTCVQLMTWCPSEWLCAQDWTSLKGELEISAYMKKKNRASAVTGSRVVADPAFERDYPTLAEYLFCTCFDDDPKQPRLTSTLLLFGADGCVKACLRDRAEGVCLWSAAPSVAELFGVLERELADDSGVWRLDRAAGAPEASRKPRGKGA